MLKNYLKIAFRNAVKNVGFTVINITGLALGLGSCLLIFFYITYETSFDSFHMNGDRVYRVVNERITQQGNNVSTYSPAILARTMEEEIPEVEQTLTFFQAKNTLFRKGGVSLFEENGIYAQPTFFDLFTLQFLLGSPEKALVEPNTLVITEQLAEKYFGEGWRTLDLLNETIELGGYRTFKITGVIENAPYNFHLDVDFICSFASSKNFFSQHTLQSWRSAKFYSYVLLKPDASQTQAQSKLSDIAVRYAHPKTEPYGYVQNPQLQALEDIHLHSVGYRHDPARKGNIDHVRALAVIAIFLLVIACVNFINLATARASTRFREVGLRKVVGAHRKQILIQFLGESVITAMCALVLAGLIVEAFLPVVNFSFGLQLSINFITDYEATLLFIAFGLLTGVLAGAYPALFLSALKPIKIFKTTANNLGRKWSMRKTLVVVQFTITALLLLVTWVVSLQTDYLKTKTLGFEKEQVVVMPMVGRSTRERYETFKNELASADHVQSATACFGLPGYFVVGDDIHLPEKGLDFSTRMMIVDPSFITTMGMKMAAGRDFDIANVADPSNAFIINETAALTMGYSDPQEALGLKVDWGVWSSDTDSIKSGQIIGVVKDFHFRSLHNDIEPITLHISPEEFNTIAVKIDAQHITEALAGIEQVWNDWHDSYPFDYHFLNEDFENLYASETRFSDFFSAFTLMAILVACLGLFGLAAFITVQNAKAISIRKVFGATVSDILVMLNGQFLKLILVALLVAFPIGFYLSNQWLEGYPYRIDLGWQIAMGTGLVTIGVALLTISYISIKAALANPVNTLRDH
ncbi:MAG: ABC transporter permease [Bacteroidota bacterium]